MKYSSPLGYGLSCFLEKKNGQAEKALVFFCKKFELGKLVLEFLGLEYYVKYPSPLNSGMVVYISYLNNVPLKKTHDNKIYIL